MLSTASKLLRTVHSVFRLSPTPVSFFSLPVPLSLSAQIAESSSSSSFALTTESAAMQLEIRRASLEQFA